MDDEAGVKRPDQTIELHSDGETTGYADLPNGGRIHIELAASDTGVNDDQVYVRLGDRKMRGGHEARLPPGSYNVELKLGIDPNPPNRPKPPKSWRARIHVYSN